MDETIGNGSGVISTLVQASTPIAALPHANVGHANPLALSRPEMIPGHPPGSISEPGLTIFAAQAMFPGKS